MAQASNSRRWPDSGLCVHSFPLHRICQFNFGIILGDITKRTRIEGASVDLIYLSTVFHGFSKSETDGFQKEVKRLLKPNAVLAIVEFKKIETPFGPPLEIRFSPEALKEAIILKPKSLVEVGKYFYMQSFENMYS